MELHQCSVVHALNARDAETGLVNQYLHWKPPPAADVSNQLAVRLALKSIKFFVRYLLQIIGDNSKSRFGAVPGV